jgi:hypothetical protein
MIFNDINEIKHFDFAGFMKINQLFDNFNLIPDIKGVYFILYIDSVVPQFLWIGTGGQFKGRDPNISMDELRLKWVENTNVVYIGKAGGINSNATLRSRLRQYLRFGQGKNIGHWGGRYIWQMKNVDTLLICWKALPNDDPREIEIQLLCQFKEIYGCYPYANLVQ